jgi:P-type Ca2+ transporter type 2C
MPSKADGVSQESAIAYIEQCPSSPISDSFVDYISKRSAEMASSGLRVLALAVRRVSAETAESIVKSNKHTISETELTFVGLIGLIDPPKQGVKESIRICKEAGIKVIMITGF